MPEAAHKPFTLTVHKYLPLALLYFFFNSVGLPLGLVYTSLLAPVFYVWLIRQGHRLVLTKFCLALLPFIVMHLFQTPDYLAYSISLALALALYITGYLFYVGINSTRRLDELMESMIVINAAMAAVALVVKFSPFVTLMWRVKDEITASVDPMARLRMFTYEPSYYATLVTPLFLYACFAYEARRTSRNLALIAATTAPLLMAYSFGVIAGLVLAAVAVHVFYPKRFLLNRRALAVALIAAVIVISMATLQTSFAIRVRNVLTGADSSGNARTILSYVGGYEIAARRSLLWGVGFGQIKLLAGPILQWNDGRIPCAFAETIAQFGLVGAALRLAVQIYLFFRTKVYRNHYRFTLFTFMFIYQFTGSFLTSLPEYVIWILCFSPVLPQFDTSAVRQPEPETASSLAALRASSAGSC